MHQYRCAAHQAACTCIWWLMLTCEYIQPSSVLRLKLRAHLAHSIVLKQRLPPAICCHQQSADCAVQSKLPSCVHVVMRNCSVHSKQTSYLLARQAARQGGLAVHSSCNAGARSCLHRAPCAVAATGRLAPRNPPPYQTAGVTAAVHSITA